jgi:hypothetical protein
MGEFWVVRDGERIGPFAEEEILRGYESGALQGSDVLWAEGMRDGATVAEAFTQLRKAILTSSQELVLADIRPPDRPVASPEVPDMADLLEGPFVRAASRTRRRRRIALAATLAVVAVAVLAYFFLA